MIETHPLRQAGPTLRWGVAWDDLPGCHNSCRVRQRLPRCWLDPERRGLLGPYSTRYVPNPDGSAGAESVSDQCAPDRHVGEIPRQ